MTVLSIIIVSCNTKELLNACLSSIYQYRPPFSFEIISVDNASCDGSFELIRSKFPGVRLIRNRSNIGFAAACNQGASMAAGRYLLFLNSDTRVHRTTLNGAVSYMTRHPEIGILGCRTLNPDGSLQGTALDFPTILRIFANVSGLNRILKISSLENRRRRRNFDYVQGSFLLIAKSVFDRCQGFDKCFFLYGEDVDLCLRVRAEGLQIAYEPHISITHHGGGSNRNQATRLFHFVNGCLMLYEKHRSAAQVKMLAKLIKPALAIRLITCFDFSDPSFKTRKELLENLFSLPTEVKRKIANEQ